MQPTDLYRALLVALALGLGSVSGFYNANWSLIERNWLILMNTSIAHLLSEVYWEIFRNQIYFSFFSEIFESKKKYQKNLVKIP